MADTTASPDFFGQVAGPLMIYGALSSAVGSYYSAKAAKAQYQLQADLSRVNSRIAETAAQTELLAGQRAQQTVKMRTSQLKAKQRVAFAENGLDLSSGSVQDTLTTTDYMGEIDANTVEANAVQAAWGHRVQGMNSSNEALMSDANAYGINPTSNAMSSLLGSASSVATSYYMMNKAGVKT